MLIIIGGITSFIYLMHIVSCLRRGKLNNGKNRIKPNNKQIININFIQNIYIFNIYSEINKFAITCSNFYHFICEKLN